MRIIVNLEMRKLPELSSAAQPLPTKRFLGENDDNWLHLIRNHMSNFFIASLEELKGLIDFSPGMGTGIGGIEVDLLMLCNLEAILTGIDWESVFDKDYINPITDEGPDGPWVYKVSEGLLEALKRLSPDAVLKTAKEWAETDEWTLRENEPQENIAAVIQKLASMAKKAKSEGKSIFIRTEP